MVDSHAKSGRAPAKFELATTIDWYRQGANWLVGLSTGAIAAGLTIADRVALHGFAARVVLFTAGLAFLATILAGVASYFWLNSLGNSMEQRARVGAEIDTHGSDEARVEMLTAAQAAIESAGNVHGFLLGVCMWTFPVGALLAAADIGIVTFARPEPPGKHWHATGVDGQGIASVMVEEGSGEAWALQLDSAGGYVWRRTARDSAHLAMALIARTAAPTAPRIR